MSRQGQSAIYQMMTDIIMEGLNDVISGKSTRIPWHKPWVGGVAHQNMVTKHPYQGVNFITSAIVGQQFGCPYWLTNKQINKLGGKKVKDAIELPIVFWGVTKHEVEDQNTGEMVEKPYWFLRYYTVFNATQVNGITIPETAVQNPDFEPLQKAEDIMDIYPGKLPSFKTTRNRAYYNRLRDEIGLPPFKQFDSAETYAATKFHELIHSTGIKERLNRKSLLDSNGILEANDDYSIEELTAEIGSSMLCAIVGIDDKVISNQIAYCQGWLDRLQNNTRFVVTASQAAQKAVNYILGKKKRYDN